MRVLYARTYRNHLVNRIFTTLYNSIEVIEHSSILLKETRVFAKFDQFLPVRSHFDTKRPVIFVHLATFPSPTFGPLLAFHCPLFFTKNNNLECRDVLKTVTVTSDQKRFGPYTAHN